MPSIPSRTRSSAIASRRKLAESRDLYIDLFTSALNSLLSTDEDRIKELTDAEAEEIVNSAAKIAERALTKIEERFPGV